MRENIRCLPGVVIALRSVPDLLGRSVVGFFLLLAAPNNELKNPGFFFGLLLPLPLLEVEPLLWGVFDPEFLRLAARRFRSFAMIEALRHSVLPC
jgi:hypothetical protein